MARTQANRGLIVQLELVERERALKVALEPALAVDLAAGIGVMEDLEAATATSAFFRSSSAHLPFSGARTIPMLALIAMVLPKMW